jgi:hypothetical protein
MNKLENQNRIFPKGEKVSADYSVGGFQYTQY